jgi:hypothetical protein
MNEPHPTFPVQGHILSIGGDARRMKKGGMRALCEVEADHMTQIHRRTHPNSIFGLDLVGLTS